MIILKVKFFYPETSRVEDYVTKLKNYFLPILFPSLSALTSFELVLSKCLVHFKQLKVFFLKCLGNELGFPLSEVCKSLHLAVF